jgi:sugar/nucleoside kinase (ribokinase family)
MRAVILGGVAWNTMVYLDAFPHPAPQTVFARGMHETVGSSGAGKALNLRRLGVEVDLWARIGDDEPGRRIRDVLDAEGIRFVPELDPLGTARHVNLMDAEGERISIFGNAGSISGDVDVAPVVPLLEGADLVSVTILDHCRAFLPIMEDLDVPMWVDIHDYDGTNPYHDAFIDAADHLIMSTVALPDWRGFAESRVDAGAEVVVCTHGTAGASAIGRAGTWVDVPAAPVDRVVDTNGAGDAFFAGFAVARAAGAEMADAMAEGTAHAARAVTSLDLAGGPIAG